MRTPRAVESFGQRGFRVDGVWRPGSLLIVSDEARDWRPAALTDVTADDLAPILQAPAGSVEFVLLGTGPTQALPPKPIRDALAAARIGLEFMATDAAASQHNVLSAQGRLFATALIAI